MLVFEGKISRWGRRGYVIYIPREYESIAGEYHGKEVIVVVLRKGANP